MLEFTIRQATGSDFEIEAISEIEKKCFPYPWSKEAIKEELCENVLSYFLIAECNGQICGYVSSWLLFNIEAEVGNLAVLPEFRRNGIAKSLMQSLINYSQSKNIYEITLEVRASNQKAISLYEKLGFKKAGLRKKYYQGTEDAILMALYKE